MTQKLTPDEIGTMLEEGETAERFLILGRNAVAAVLASDFEVEAVASTSELPEGLAERRVSTLTLTKAEAEGLLGFFFHRGMLAIARKPVRSFSDWAENHSPKRLVVMETLADPGNVGTVIRNAAAFGFDAVICTETGSSPYNAKAVRASATGLFHLPVFVEENWREAISKAVPGITILGAALSPEAVSLESLQTDPPSSPLAIVLGSESDGLCTESLSACDCLIYIPISDKLDSLNVASASAILLHALGDI